MKMAFRYKTTKQLVAEGLRTVIIDNGKLYIQTSVTNIDLQSQTGFTVTYNLKEIYDDTITSVVNHAPTGQGTDLSFDISNNQKGTTV